MAKNGEQWRTKFNNGEQNSNLDKMFKQWLTMANNGVVHRVKRPWNSNNG